MEQGLIHIYCGDGKGKTSAAIGLAVRAAGRGKKVLFARFLKTEDSGELRILEQIPEITVLNPEGDFACYYTLDSEKKNAVVKQSRALWEKVLREAQTGHWDVLVMDELMVALQLGILNLDSVKAFLENKPKELEVVLTGRNPGNELTEFADYVSEIQSVKHPFDRGIGAREGIEY